MMGLGWFVGCARFLQGFWCVVVFRCFGKFKGVAVAAGALVAVVAMEAFVVCIVARLLA